MTITSRRLTYEDLARLPDDGERHEIVAGRHVVLPAPSLWHRKIVTRLVHLIHADLTRHNLGDDLFTGPVDVKFAEDTVVEPDLVYVGPSRRSILADPRFIASAPDLIVEILSPSNRSYDEQTKFGLYAANRVPEYWIADPEQRTLRIFALRNGAYELLPNENGIARSVLLPGLEIDVPALFANLTERSDIAGG